MRAKREREGGGGGGERIFGGQGCAGRLKVAMLMFQRQQTLCAYFRGAQAFRRTIHTNGEFITGPTQRPAHLQTWSQVLEKKWCSDKKPSPTPTLWMSLLVTSHWKKPPTSCKTSRQTKQGTWYYSRGRAFLQQKPFRRLLPKTTKICIGNSFLNPTTSKKQKN